MYTINYPVVPFVQTIHEELCSGAKIIIKGQPAEHHHHSQDFAIELLSGPHIILHVNFRFDHGTHKEHKVIMNSCVDGSWGREARYSNPIHHHDQFTIIIEVHESHYTIHVNGTYVGSFTHRINYTLVQAIGIKGQANIEKIEFEGFHFYDNWGNEYNYGHSGYDGYGTEYYVPPVFSDDHPFRHHFHGRERRHSQESWDS